MIGTKFDLLVRNGMLVDGTGNPWYRADIGVLGERIASIGDLSSATAERKIDAQGLVVSPGFIDIHSHSDMIYPLEDDAEILEPFIRQGTTTQVIGNCGISPAPVSRDVLPIMQGYLALITARQIPWNWSSMSDYLQRIERKSVCMNVAPLVGHGAIRFSVMSASADQPSPSQMEEMKTLLTQSLAYGAFGMSIGLIYPPGMWTDTSQLIELSRIVAAYDGVLTCHVRGSSETAVYSEKEIIKIGETTGVRVQHSHHEAFGKPHWNKVYETMKLDEEARKRGVDIASDIIPYTCASTYLFAIYPPWSLEGGVPQLLNRLKDPPTRKRIFEAIEETVPGWPPWIPGAWPHNLVLATGWENIYILSVATEKNKTLEGRKLTDIARDRGLSPFDTAAQVILEENADIMALYYGVSGDKATEGSLQFLIQHPWSAVGPDAIIRSKGLTHPGAYGSFPKVLGLYSRDLNLFTLEDAVRKMTSLPATRIGLRDRGILAEGMAADIVAFDPKSVRDNTTYDELNRYPNGIEYVIINGQVVAEKGRVDTRIRAGKVLRRKKSTSDR